jgi:acetyl-CoA synthetase (ADP-forming)
MRDPQWLYQVLSQMMADPNVGAGIFVMTTQPDMVGAAQVVIDLNKSGTKPLLFVNAASSCASDALERLKAAGMVQFASVKEAARYLVNHLTAAPNTDTDQPWQEQLSVTEVDRVAAALPMGLVGEYQTKQLLSAAGVPTTGGALAQSEDQAVELAHSIGFPVVMKVVSAQISHKSDIGGVALNVRDDAGVRQQFNLLRAALQNVPGARFEACLVQQMVGADAELLIGSQWDPQFGAMLMFGFGGTLVELQRDTALLPAHASQQSIERALGGLRHYPLLTGYRGSQPADLATLVRIIQRIGQLALHLGEQLTECEVNPVMVRGDSIWAADARAVWKEKT